MLLKQDMNYHNHVFWLVIHIRPIKYMYDLVVYYGYIISFQWTRVIWLPILFRILSPEMRLSYNACETIWKVIGKTDRRKTEKKKNNK